MSPPQHRLAAGALSSANRAVELGTSCVATRRGQQGKLRGPESTPTALLARANWATCDEVNLGGFGRVRANVHAEERVPARINGNAAETFGRRQIGPPAHHYLAGMEYDAIEHAACTAHAGFVLVANEEKEFRFVHGDWRDAKSSSRGGTGRANDCCSRKYAAEDASSDSVSDRFPRRLRSGWRERGAPGTHCHDCGESPQ